MFARSRYFHRAQVCLSLARTTEDPELRDRYEDLAVDFLHLAGGREDSEFDAPAPVAPGSTKFGSNSNSRGN